MRLIVNAQGVEALVKLDPEHTIELAKHSAKTVADNIVTKLAKESVAQIIKAHINNVLIVKPVWSSTVLSQAAEKLIKAALDTKVDTLVSMKVMSPQYVEIQQSIAAIFEAQKEKALKQLSNDIDVLIKDRIAEFFKQVKG
jgi:hypothetical protein